MRGYGLFLSLEHHPQHWPCKGPITSLFWSYLGARSIPWPSKLQMAGYLGTYLAMAYSVVGICSYVILRMFYGVLQVCAISDDSNDDDDDDYDYDGSGDRDESAVPFWFLCLLCIRACSICCVRV